MKTISFLTLGLLMALNVYAASAKSYQVTGPVLEVSDKMMIVQKGDEKWELAADKELLAKVKAGDKVTVQYQMVAKGLEVKPAK